MWPTISGINESIASKINSYPANLLNASNLNAWVRIFSGAVKDGYQGLIMESNTNWKLFNAAGEGSSIYGNSQQSGTLGRDWNGNSVNVSGRGFRPSPIITSLTSKEGKDQISRTCDFNITCYSLEQLEYLQTYFMEPGYSIGVEWGWNTPDAVMGLVETQSTETILKGIADTTLNNKDLGQKRIHTVGEYDVFLGFIVGSIISNDGENFKIDVKLRGQPSLATYLQSQHRIQKPDKEKEGNSDKSSSGYGSTKTIETLDDDNKRRFRTMFNELPSFRQTDSVKSLEEFSKKEDYINFDPKIAQKIADYSNTSFWKSLWGTDKIAIGSITFPKDKLFSNNRYIKFGLAIDILNKIGYEEDYKIGNKHVSLTINIDNTIIGAFPKMFSTNASKLIIPGEIPKFSEYFLTSNEVVQYNDGKLNNSNPTIFNDDLASFVENDNLKDFNLKEVGGYYGYLKNLYINFDMFVNKIEQNQKTIREVLLDILNEISSAVNGFWNFQIVEGEFKKNNETTTNELREMAPFVAATNELREMAPFVAARTGQIWENNPIKNLSSTIPNTPIKNVKTSNKTEGDIEITIIDENWVGQIPDGVSIIEFKHSGISTPFINSSLDISIPNEMAGKIVMNRMGYDSQKDINKISTTGSFFESSLDLFWGKVSEGADVSGLAEGSGVNGNQSVDDDVKVKKNWELIQSEENKIDKSKTTTSANLGGTIIVYKDKDGNTIKTSTFSGPGSARVRYENRELKRLKLEDIEAAQEYGKELSEGIMTEYMEKIDVVPNQKRNDLTIGNDVKKLIGEDLLIYCFNDTDFFEMMKNYYTEEKYKNGIKGLSQPLPIKYSFTILGNSGIRRGEVFNIDGIPEKYKKRGLFQVTEIEHSISDMKWVTTVTGQYRQTQ
jgi:hypothetical protein